MARMLPFGSRRARFPISLDLVAGLFEGTLAAWSISESATKVA